MKKGMVYSGTFMAILLRPRRCSGTCPAVRELADGAPLLARRRCSGRWPSRCSRRSSRPSTAARRSSGGSAKSYRKPVLYLRGAVVGLGLGYGLTRAMPATAMLDAGRVRVRRRGRGVRGGQPRSATASTASRGRGRRPVVAGLPGACAAGRVHRGGDRVLPRRGPGRGGGRQVPPLPRRRARPPEPFGVHPLLSKWGFINLGTVTGGVSLLFAEALAGVISWSIPAWLFAINRTFMAAYFRKETGADPGAVHPGRAGPARREHDRGPALGPLDVADHQVVPPADGRADLVQPGRRDPHRAGDRPRPDD